MTDNRNLDQFAETIKESDFTMDSGMKQKILAKAYGRVQTVFYAKRIALVCALLILASAFIPDTPAHALAQKLFSWVPGVGIVQNTDETGRIQSVLNTPVKVTEGQEFIEIKTAYIVDQILNVSLKTNVGAVGGEFKDPAEFKRFFAEETAPSLYLSEESVKIKPDSSMWSGPSYETRVYSIEAAFVLKDDSSNRKTFKLGLEGFGKELEFTLSPVHSEISPEALGNAAVIDGVMVLANTERDGDVLEVLLSAVAPGDMKNVRFHLNDTEKELFRTSVILTDQDGNRYLPDDALRTKNNASTDTLYFRIPEDKKGLKLTVPKILYDRSYTGNEFRISLPKPGGDVRIDRALELPGSTVLIERASLIPVGDPTLPDEFKKSDCLRIDAVNKAGSNSRETVLRVLPKVEVPQRIFRYTGVSQSTYGELWDSSQKGYSITTFENMKMTGRILLKFDVEYAMTGPWEIPITVSELE